MGHVIFNNFSLPRFNDSECQRIENAAMRNAYDMDQWDQERMLVEENDHPDLTLVENCLLSRIEGLWLLCHPARHPDNQQTALEMTYWLQRVKSQLKNKSDAAKKGNADLKELEAAGLPVGNLLSEIPAGKRAGRET